MKYKTALDLEKETKVKILLVPGHEPDFGGTEYGALLEREMNVRIANMLKEKLESDEHFQVFITRDNDAWNSDFDNYFKNSWEDIKVWQKANKENIKKLISLGSTSTVDAFTPKVTHNKAPDNVALRLYGITKWANENDIDIVIHIHFNDYPRYNVYLPGVYKGFSIYVPIGQYDNSTTTNAIAKSVLKRLSTKYHISTYEAESAGIIDSPDLIAIGANNTSDAASLLIEYGYIYEKQFSTRDSRTKVFEDMASLTYLGLLDFFTGDTSVAPGYL
jgi:N-acetylmuramoyl-L-alanine amidase